MVLYLNSLILWDKRRTLDGHQTNNIDTSDFKPKSEMTQRSKCSYFMFCVTDNLFYFIILLLELNPFIAELSSTAAAYLEFNTGAIFSMATYAFTKGPRGKPGLFIFPMTKIDFFFCQRSIWPNPLNTPLSAK